MTRTAKLISMAAILLGAGGCAQLTPAESCTAICSELQQCQIRITGSSLAPGPSCQTDCESKLEARGSGCKSSASFLAECFQTYSCTGNELNCSDNASAFASDCS